MTNPISQAKTLIDDYQTVLCNLYIKADVRWPYGKNKGRRAEVVDVFIYDFEIYIQLHAYSKHGGFLDKDYRDNYTAFPLEQIQELERVIS